jgi:hypothetical protein
MTMGKDFIPRRCQGESIACSQDQNILKSYPSNSGGRREALDAELSRIIEFYQEDTGSQRLALPAFGEIFYNLSSDLSEALGLLSVSVSNVEAPAVFKILYVRAVNLVESMLISILIKAIVIRPGLRARFKISSLEGGLSSGSHEEISSEERGVAVDVASSLSLKTFCNYEYLLIEVFGARLEMLNFTAIDRIFAKRDDLLVRHGRCIEGQSAQVTSEEVERVIATLRDFAVDLNINIYHSVFDHNSSDI